MRNPLTLALATGLLVTGGAAIAQNLDPALVTQPADVVLYDAPEDELLALGEDLFDDPGLGTTGNSCLACHMGTSKNLLIAGRWRESMVMTSGRAAWRVSGVSSTSTSGWRR